MEPRDLAELLNSGVRIVVVVLVVAETTPAELLHPVEIRVADDLFAPRLDLGAGGGGANEGKSSSVTAPAGGRGRPTRWRVAS